MYKLFILCFLWLSVWELPVQAQFYSDMALDDSSRVPASQSFGLRFSSDAFFRNNEYFHPLVEGYTLPGFMLQPRFYYDLDNKFSLEAGVHLSQYSGKKGLNRVDPLFRATYSPSGSFSVILGWLNGTTNHKLIEPLYQWEQKYTNPLEYGVQFVVNKPGFSLDTWIDWQKYIELNDPFQEELTFGTSSKILLLRNHSAELWLPVQITIKHKGGQIIAVDEPLTTHTNWATGVNVVVNHSGKLIRRLMFDLYYAGFSDFSPQKRMAFRNGFGLYPVVSANISQSFLTSLGFWYGHKFIASRGEPLFQAVSFTNPQLNYPNRYVVTFKAAWYKQVFRNVNFGAYMESYYDTRLSQLDYSYGIAMAVSGDIIFGKK